MYIVWIECAVIDGPGKMSLIRMSLIRMSLIRMSLF